MAAPFPAERTPDFDAGKPSHSLPIARAVLNPTPAGSAASHQRNWRPKSRCIAFKSSGCRRSAAISISVCSVSSLSMPRPMTNRCRSPPEMQRLALRRDSPSVGRPIESPTAVPSRHPRSPSFEMGEALPVMWLQHGWEVRSNSGSTASRRCRDTRASESEDRWLRWSMAAARRTVTSSRICP